MDSSVTLKIVFVALAILLVGTGSVLAFGISSPYWKSHPLELYPGESREISFNLQNCPSLKENCDDGDANIVASFEEGSEIAEITSGDSYLVPFGSADTNIILKVSIPESASIGDEYNVKFSVSSPPAEGEGGNIQLGVKYGVSFPVEVIEEPTDVPPAADEPAPPDKSKRGNKVLKMLVVLVALILIAWIILRKKK